MTASEDKEVIAQFLNGIMADIKSQLPSATGKTAESLQVEVTETFGQLTGRKFINVLQTGRKPTSPNAPKGTPTLREKILEWILARGIIGTANEKTGKIPSAEQLSWAISTKIHKEGYPAPKPNIFNNIITQGRIDAFIEVFAANKVQQVFSQVVKGI